MKTIITTIILTLVLTACGSGNTSSGGSTDWVSFEELGIEDCEFLRSLCLINYVEGCFSPYILEEDVPVLINQYSAFCAVSD